MSRSAVSGWTGKLFLRRLRCACWGVGSKNNSTWKENGWKDEMEKDLRIAVFGAAIIIGTKI